MEQLKYMVKLPLGKDLAGRILAKPVIGHDQVLLEEGTRLEPAQLESLEKTGIRELFLESDSGMEVVLEGHPGPLEAEALELVSSYQETLDLVLAIQDSVKNDDKIEIGSCQRLVEYFSRKLGSKRSHLLELLSRKTPYNYLLSHSLNVSILAMLLGRRQGVADLEVTSLGLAGILHDLGMVKVKQVWDKEEKITQAEFFQVMRHPIYSADIIGRLHGVPGQVGVISYQHHERLDGSGYPRGLGRARIHKLSRIFMVADAYEASSSERRHKDTRHKFYSISELINLAGTQFDREAVRALVTELSLFPPGSYIRLSNGRVARVIDTNPERADRPMVEILPDTDGHRKREWVDLSDAKELKIVEVLQCNV
ncbi:MAG: HD domain-containing protein [Candidatus Wallbacteria bacterium]|nr:HD domain-containing protein [Candidatus Wallbacteria bacterium]